MDPLPHAKATVEASTWQTYASNLSASATLAPP